MIHCLSKSVIGEYGYARIEMQGVASKPRRGGGPGKRIVFAMLLLPLVVIADLKSVNGIEWKFTISEGKATVIGATPSSGTLEIPSSLGTCSVTSIGDRAFSGCSGLTSVTIPNSVTSIGSRAFYGCSGLTSVTIPNSVTSIGEGVFSMTPFYDNQPDGMVILGSVLYEMRGECPSSVTIPKRVTSIGDQAFVWRRGGFDSFVVDPGNPSYCSVDGLLCTKDGKTLIAGVNGDVVIPSSVTNIGNYAFSGCLVTSVTIPNSVTSIGDGAFCNCERLTSVTIPEGVTSIGEDVFFGCSGLTSVTIPPGVTSIGDRAFVACSELTSMTIPNSVTSIGDHAFYNCSGLTSVTIPNSVTSIGDVAFYGTPWYESKRIFLIVIVSIVALAAAVLGWRLYQRRLKEEMKKRNAMTKDNLKRGDEERAAADDRYRDTKGVPSGAVKSMMMGKTKFIPSKVAVKKTSFPENVQKAMRIASQVGIAKEAAKARQVAVEKKEQDKNGELRKQDERLGVENSSNSRNESSGLTIHLRWETVEMLFACLGGLVILITQFVARPADTINVENKNVNTDSLLSTLSELHLDFGLNCWLGSHYCFHPTFVVFWEWVGLLAIVWYIGRRIYAHVCAFGWRVHNVVRCRILAVCFLLIASVCSISVAVGPGDVKIEYPHGELTYVVQSPLYYYYPPLITDKYGELEHDEFLVRKELAELSWFGQAVLNLGIDIGVLGLILLTLRRRNNPMC